MTNTMTDMNGKTWSVGDLVLSGPKQGLIKALCTQRMVVVKFPGGESSCFVSGLINLSRQPDLVPQL